MHIMHTLNNTHSNLPSIKPFIALARQHVKTGNYEALRSEYKMWTAKGQSSAVNDASIIDLHRAMLSASATALDRMVSVVSRVLKDRQANTLPDDVLPGMMTPPQLSLLQFGEASYLWIRTQEAINGITEDRLTQEDYDTIMRILTRLNLLQPSQWSLEKHARKVIPEMKQRGLKPLKSTYFTLMETIARTREYGASRGNGQVARQARKVFEEMTQEGYAATSAKDFRPLIEACFGIYSHSPFVAGQWMYSNQLYPVCNSALEKVEQMMQKALAPEDQGESSSSTGSNSIHRYHDSTTIAALLAGLAHGDQVDELWKRWDDLALQGIERDAKLYQTVIGASQGQEKLAQYVLRTVRYEMQKEQPPIPMTPEIFSGLLNCCVRAQDTISARSLIAQCSLSGEIQKSAEWYVPMVRTCLVLEGLEEEGTFLLEEMRKSDMKMDSFSGSFYEFLMSYFVTKRMDHQAGREIFKRFVQSEQQKITELLEARERMKHIRLDEELEDDQQQVLIFSNKELTKRARRLQAPVEHLVERVDISARTASMLNLLMLSYIRERMTLLEHEQRSGFGAGAQEHLRNARAVIHCLVGERKVHQLAQGMGLQTSSVSIPNTIISSPESQGSDSLSRLLDQSLLTSQSRVPEPGHQSNGRLIFVNKYALGEYIDTCIKEGSPEMLEEASWALNRIMPRVIGEARIAKDTQRLRQALENARSRQYGEMDI
ncbi:hypothetical protein BC939DRAFT_304 [Gamsiella multidivaricata]|uniref:uncharacterized protein n=1 Tax=Gamsiella multidivaricata TaxID=101098 RepID=UPI00221EF467|nr:uncharacterized protein BC939DRAFT_304 [Gamsiella multidivaricata]KAI7832529.1 hypothetical protein BC939DRAFT_304 [Gamsiella multidivaricata]